MTEQAILQAHENTREDFTLEYRISECSTEQGCRGVQWYCQQSSAIPSISYHRTLLPQVICCRLCCYTPGMQDPPRKKFPLGALTIVCVALFLMYLFLLLPHSHSWESEPPADVVESREGAEPVKAQVGDSAGIGGMATSQTAASVSVKTLGLQHGDPTQTAESVTVLASKPEDAEQAGAALLETGQEIKDAAGEGDETKSDGTRQVQPVVETALSLVITQQMSQDSGHVEGSSRAGQGSGTGAPALVPVPPKPSGGAVPRGTGRTISSEGLGSRVTAEAGVLQGNRAAGRKTIFTRHIT